MTAVYLVRGGAHPISTELLQVGIYSSVVVGDDVPTGLRPPGRYAELLVEQVGVGCALCGPDGLLLLVGQVAAEVRGSVWSHPDSTVLHLDVLDDVRSV